MPLACSTKVTTYEHPLDAKHKAMVERERVKQVPTSDTIPPKIQVEPAKLSAISSAVAEPSKHPPRAKPQQIQSVAKVVSVGPQAASESATHLHVPAVYQVVNTCTIRSEIELSSAKVCFYANHLCS